MQAHKFTLSVLTLLIIGGASCAGQAFAAEKRATPPHQTPLAAPQGIPPAMLLPPGTMYPGSPMPPISGANGMPPGMMKPGSPMPPVAGSGGMLPGMMNQSAALPMAGANGGMNPGLITCAMGAYIDGQLAFIKAELKITEAQTPKWDAYAEAYRNAVQHMEKNCAMLTGQGVNLLAMAETLTTRLDNEERRLALPYETLQTVKKAVLPLYSALSNEQKKKADQIILPRHPLM